MSHEPAIHFGVFLATLLAMLLWEQLAPARPRAPKGARWIGNLGIAAVSALARFLIPLAPVGAALLAARNGWGLFHSIAVPGWVGGLTAFFALDLAVYLQHRLLHAVPLLWRLHRMHHADIALDATTGLRFHPLEIILSFAIKVAVVIALGADPLAVLVFEVALNAFSMFNHANVRLPESADRIVRRVLVTPAMHSVHHSIVRAETDSNFGFSVPWWDWLFRTYRARAAAGDAAEIGLGIFRDPHASRLDRLLVQPFVSPTDR